MRKNTELKRVVDRAIANGSPVVVNVPVGKSEEELRCYSVEPICTCGEGDMPGLAHCIGCPKNAGWQAEINEIKASLPFSASARTALLGLLWDSLKRDPDHKDRRQTGFGTKTKEGLVACIEGCIKENA
jgi:hypothetical protein